MKYNSTKSNPLRL